MTEPEDLSRFTATAESGAAFSATKDGGLVTLVPLTPRATTWLSQHVDDEATWLGEALVVEERYFFAIADGIMDAGFTFERPPLPN